MSEKLEINDPSNLRKRFDDSGRTPAKYAVAKGLQETALRRVFDGTTNGKNARKEGQTRKVFCHLKQDGIWIGKLPWERLPSKEVV
ncbi:hypothetical protein [Sulfurimonas sp.]